MIEIRNTLVSLDLIERYFCCDLEACKGACCIEGDAGAPVTEEECAEIEKALPAIEADLLPGARQAIHDDGVAYTDEEGDLVTTIIHGANCAFSCYDADGKCICALEKACREGRSGFLKPQSCHLYPVRLKEYDGFTAVNFHRWKICKPAEVLGRKLGLRAYKFLREPLVAHFGQEWYDELCFVAEEYLKQYPTKD